MLLNPFLGGELAALNQAGIRGTRIQQDIQEALKKVPRCSQTRPERLLEYKPRKYGKHKIKRYLYHMTSEENYRKMLQSGMIKTSKDGCFGTLDGVFMTDLQNLTKRWRCSKDWAYLIEQHLGVSLLDQASKESNDIVCLRIPTENLNHEILKIRSQNRLFRTICMGKDKSDLAQDAHEIIGSHAKNRNLFTRRKEAIEYIYSDNIPMSDVQLVGKADLKDLVSLVEKTPNSYKGMQGNLILTTLKTLFKGQPEIKGLNIIS